MATMITPNRVLLPVRTQEQIDGRPWPKQPYSESRPSRVPHSRRRRSMPQVREQSPDVRELRVVSKPDAEDDQRRSSETTKSGMVTQQCTILIIERPISLNQAVQLWLETADALRQSHAERLMRTPEMQSFITASRYLVCSAGETAIKTALLPVTIPVHVACCTGDLAVKGCAHVIQAASRKGPLAVIEGPLHVIGNVAGSVASLPGIALGVVGHVKDEIGSFLIHALFPEECEARSDEPSVADQSQVRRQDRDNFLEKLHLNYSPEAPYEYEIEISSRAGEVDDATLLNDEKTVASAPSGTVTKLDSVELLVVKDELDDTSHACDLDETDWSPSCDTVKEIVTSKREESFLDRLRLDYVPPSCSSTCLTALTDETSLSGSIVTMPTLDTLPSSHKSVQGRVPKRIDYTQTSKFLLRVDDLAMFLRSESEVNGILECKIYYIDLYQAACMGLRKEAMDKLYHCGTALLANHATVKLGTVDSAVQTAEVKWHPEGSTGRLLRRLSNMPTLERLRTLHSELLLWSGTMNGNSFGSKNPFFLARGIVGQCPREFMELLWNDTRTSEYNDYCMGRSCILELGDDVISGGSSMGTKVVRSKTRVPFTSLSVMMTCVMHVRPLESPDEGYIILTRSLDTGVAGTHVGSDRNVEKGMKNDIVWGINIIRRVNGRPQLTDLTSLSQVASTLLPTFLAKRIGLMAVEDFFKNVRKLQTTSS